MKHELLLLKCWDDWYSLEGGGNWASIEGTAEEWREVASVLRGGDRITFKRLACRKQDGLYRLHSPRNAVSIHDVVWVPLNESEALADHIEEVLREEVQSARGADGGREMSEQDRLIGLIKDGSAWVVLTFDAHDPVVDMGNKLIVTPHHWEALRAVRAWEPGDTTQDTWRKLDEGNQRLLKALGPGSPFWTEDFDEEET